MSYRKQLPVALPGHGCATRKSHDSQKILNLQKTIIQRPIYKNIKQVFRKRDK